jgi:futalosine hydrolase
MTTLVVVAVEQERDAVLRDLPAAADVDVDVVVSGVGPIAAATTTARALSARGYDAVVSAGICGGFSGRAESSAVVVATASVAADLGCRTDDGFLTLDDMGLPQPSRLALSAAPAWAERLRASDLDVRTGEMLTLSCMTGTDVEAKQLAERYPDALAEAMEGFGVLWAARDVAVAGEVRTVSNVVGRRDPSTWDIAGALDALSRAFAALLAEPL